MEIQETPRKPWIEPFMERINQLENESGNDFVKSKIVQSIKRYNLV